MLDPFPSSPVPSSPCSKWWKTGWEAESISRLYIVISHSCLNSSTHTNRYKLLCFLHNPVHDPGVCVGYICIPVGFGVLDLTALFTAPLMFHFSSVPSCMHATKLLCGNSTLSSCRPFTPFTHNLSWCSGSIRQKLQRVFEKVQPYRANFKVGYEAR